LRELLERFKQRGGSSKIDSWDDVETVKELAPVCWIILVNP